MKQQIILSGTGGQGVLFLTRFFAEAALLMGSEVITSEIHGMAMRGGTVLSHVKVGPFRSPLVRAGQADAGLILNAENLEIHRPFVRPGGSLFVNTKASGDYYAIDASSIALECGSAAVTNLVLLGHAVEKGVLFCDAKVAEAAIRKISPAVHAELNMKAFAAGGRF